jgi:DNA-binding LacI/PurR family transcriptional regulator
MIAMAGLVSEPRIADIARLSGASTATVDRLSRPPPRWR